MEVVGIVTINLKKIYRRRKIMTTKLIQYAVVFEPFETEGLEYVKQGCGAMWDDKSPIKLFDTHEDAQKEADKWNTGQVVQYG
jgi:hypothetical protein